MKTNSVIFSIVPGAATGARREIGRRALRRLVQFNVFAALLGTLGTGSFSALASDPVGIYALVDKVVFEPNAQSPERLQIWGAFALAEGSGVTYAKSQRGYLYYKLNPKKPEVCRKEWADLNSVAGTGQVVAFGSRYEDKGAVHKAEAKPEQPDLYPLGWGMSKAANKDYQPVKELLALHKPKPPAAGESKTKKD